MFKKIVKSISKTKGKTELFLSHILIPLWILTFYFFLASRLLPAGINNAFVTNSGKNLLRVTSLLSLLFLALFIFRKGKLSFPEKSKDKFSLSNLFLLLFPLTPLIQYLLYNLKTLSFGEVIYIFFVFALSVTFFVLFVPVLFKRVGSSQVLMFIGLAFTFTIINMGSLSQEFGWHEVGSLKIQFLVFSAVSGISWLFFYIGKERLIYALIVIFFITIATTPFLEGNISFTESSLPEINNKLLKLLGDRKPKITPSIYLLVYDAYVINETMLAYGIDNQSQEEYLEELGFQIYPHTYSIGSPSVSTMSRVLNASTEFYGNSRRGVSGDGVVQNLLKEFGYQTYGLFPTDHFFQGIPSSYDYTYPKYITTPKDLLIKAILVGEFKFDLGMSDVSREYFLEEKHNILATQTDTPKFVYMHTNRPNHSQNSGVCLSNETDLFSERLIEANSEMREDLETILRKDPNSIIIVAGDHGGYLTKNCFLLSGSYGSDEITRLDIQDRFGTFLAIKWPMQDFKQYDDITVLQDLFPSVFSYIFQDPNLQKAKVETMTLENMLSGVKVIDGIIEGGIDDGTPLFIGANE